MEKVYVQRVCVVIGKTDKERAFDYKTAEAHEIGGVIKITSENKTLMEFSKSLPHLIEYYSTK